MDKDCWVNINGETRFVPSIKSICDSLVIKFKNYQEIIDRLRKENKELKDKHYENKEIKKLQDELKTERENNERGFPISKTQADKINKWIVKHEEEHHNGRVKSLIRGKYSYIFIPTSIGTFCTVKCTCGEEIDVSEDI